MALAKISPQKAKALMDAGAVLVDIREPGERAASSIESSLSLPLSELATREVPKDAEIVIYHCRSGMRTSQNAAALKDKSGCEAYILDGGIEAWRRAGLPLAAAQAKAPMEMLRQVQITAGLMALAGVVLALNGSPAGLWLAGFVAAGLVFSGVTGTCPMASLLALMPWNRASA